MECVAEVCVVKWKLHGRRLWRRIGNKSEVVLEAVLKPPGNSSRSWAGFGSPKTGFERVWGACKRLKAICHGFWNDFETQNKAVKLSISIFILVLFHKNSTFWYSVLKLEKLVSIGWGGAWRKIGTRCPAH